MTDLPAEPVTGSHRVPCPHDQAVECPTSANVVTWQRLTAGVLGALVVVLAGGWTWGRALAQDVVDAGQAQIVEAKRVAVEVKEQAALRDAGLATQLEALKRQQREDSARLDKKLDDLTGILIRQRRGP